MFEIPWIYALFMVLALATGLLLKRWSPMPGSLTGGQRAAIGLGAFVGAMLAAKLPFVLAGGGWLDPGKTVLAGLAGGYLGVELAKAAVGARVKTGDSFAVPLAAALAVGRLGCFFHGCCGGAPATVPWAIDGRHPAALYEVAFHALMAALLWRLYRRGAFRLQLLKLYLIAYGAFRFGIEFVRVEPRLPVGLTPYQLGALGLIGAMALLWAADARSKTSTTAAAAR
jgi:prolipoprotein diacylglyceryltransferase